MSRISDSGPSVPPVAAEALGAIVAPEADGGPQAGMAAAQLNLAEADRAEARESIAQIEAMQAKRRDFAAALRAARDLRRVGARGRATPAEYARALAACRHARYKKGAVSGLLLKFCQSHGVKINLPDNSQDDNAAPWTDAMAVLERMRAVNAVCDAMRMDMPFALDKAENQAQWDAVIDGLQIALDGMGADIRSRMAQLQDTMGRYNSYTQGANAAIARSGEAASDPARGQQVPPPDLP